MNFADNVYSDVRNRKYRIYKLSGLFCSGNSFSSHAAVGRAVTYEARLLHRT